MAADDSYSANEDTALTVAAAGRAGQRHRRGRQPADRGAGERTQPRHADPQRQRLVHLHPGGQLQRRRQLHLQGQRRHGQLATRPRSRSPSTPSTTPRWPSTTATARNEDTALTVAAAGRAGQRHRRGRQSADRSAGQRPGHGTLTLNANGSFTYTPAANYNGTDSFTYRPTTGRPTRTPPRSSITVTPVNDAPVAANDSYSTNEDTALTVAAAGRAGQRHRRGRQPADRASWSASPTHGTLTLNANGSFTYTPAANYNGAGQLHLPGQRRRRPTRNTATVTITINPVNDAPVAVNDSYSTNEDTALTVAAPGVLGNDTRRGRQPAHGQRGRQSVPRHADPERQRRPSPTRPRPTTTARTASPTGPTTGRPTRTRPRSRSPSTLSMMPRQPPTTATARTKTPP